MALQVHKQEPRPQLAAHPADFLQALSGRPPPAPAEPGGPSTQDPGEPLWVGPRFSCRLNLAATLERAPTSLETCTRLSVFPPRALTEHLPGPISCETSINKSEKCN